VRKPTAEKPTAGDKKPGSAEKPATGDKPAKKDD
jgi:hypothetical protein